MTRRAFCGDIRTCRARACASIEGACVCSSAMVYAFGAAAAAGAAPPAGAAPAAFSRAALTACPLNVRVGAKSPSLCPIICSVMYTGINFFPLCTAMVWPIISGTMVDRRDQVFTTFFSFRALSASTLFRRGASTNGPFFNERAIDVLPYLPSANHKLYSSTRRSLIHCARRTLRKPRTAPDTRCDCGQNGQTKRVPCWLGCRSTSTAHPVLQNRNNTGSTGAVCAFVAFLAGFEVRYDLSVLRAPEGRRATDKLRDALMVTLSVTRRARIMIALYILRSILLIRTDYFQAPQLGLPTLNDHALGAAVMPRLCSEGREAPGRLGVIALHPAFTAAMRVVHRIHGHASHRRPLAMPTRPPSIAVGNVFVVQIADLADGGHAIDAKAPHFTGRQLYQRQIAFLAQQLRRNEPRSRSFARPRRLPHAT